MDDFICVLCNKPGKSGSKDVVAIREKGSEGINRASQERNDDIVIVPGQKVHKKCRQEYCKPQNIERAKEPNAASSSQNRRPSVRSVESLFSFQTDCFYCGSEVVFQSVDKKSRSRDAFKVATLETKNVVLGVCSQRGDMWAEAVRARLLHVHDLPASDAVYHQSCSVNFRTGKQIPQSYSTTETASKKMKTGRPQNKEKRDAFLATVQYLRDNDEELLLSISDLQDKMNDYLGNPELCAYGHTHMKEELLGHLKNEIVITEINGRSNVVTLKSTADSILQEFHKSQVANKSQEEEKQMIIQTAARLIKQEIKSVTTPGTSYPQVDADVEKHLDFLPQSLRLFLTNVLAGKSRIKLASIGQTIMQATRPRALMAPLQIGLAIQLHHNFASRFLVDSLNSLGFCSSYDEVQNFSKNASSDQGTDIPSFGGDFVQYVGDNVDHNIRTLDGNIYLSRDGDDSGCDARHNARETCPEERSGSTGNLHGGAY